MLDIDKFISENVTERSVSLFLKDIEANSENLRREIEGKKVLVIGGAGSIGSSFIRAILPFRPAKLTVVDLNENGLAELTRDIRSRADFYVPKDYVTYTLDFDSPIFRRIFKEAGGFDIVANFSAHKHVRSEKDRNSVQALLENNVVKA
ncbi:MAG: polysaccharide biosynthesis protein, partial [Muribaculaceae bacterium]|nr:polysaccharide biosynthesis protein [Muribaculaceae bacterium]